MYAVLCKRPYRSTTKNEKKKRHFIRLGTVQWYRTYHRYRLRRRVEGEWSVLLWQTPRANKDFPYTIPMRAYKRHGRAKPLTPTRRAKRKGGETKRERKQVSHIYMYVRAYIRRSERTNFSHDEIKILSDTRWYKTKHRHAWWPEHARSLRQYRWLSSQRPPTESLRYILHIFRLPKLSVLIL